MLAEVFQYLIGANIEYGEIYMLMFGYVLLFVVGLFVVLLPIGAVALRAAAKWIASIDIEFGKAYTTLLVTGLIAGIIAGPIFLMSMLVFAVSRDLRLLSVFPLVFIVQAAVISWRLSVTFGKALLISLVTLSVLIGIVAIGYLARLFGMAVFLS